MSYKGITQNFTLTLVRRSEHRLLTGEVSVKVRDIGLTLNVWLEGRWYLVHVVWCGVVWCGVMWQGGEKRRVTRMEGEGREGWIEGGGREGGKDEDICM